jgi:hypothetical protein
VIACAGSPGRASRPSPRCCTRRRGSRSRARTSSGDGGNARNTAGRAPRHLRAAPATRSNVRSARARA